MRLVSRKIFLLVFAFAALLSSSDVFAKKCTKIMREVSQEGTALGRFYEHSKNDPEKIVQRSIDKTTGELKETSLSALIYQTTQIASNFKSVGLAPKDILLIHGSNRSEWVNLALGAQLARGIAGGVYLGTSADDVAYALELTKAKFFAVENEKQLYDLFGKNLERIPDNLQKIILMDKPEQKINNPRIITFEQLIVEGRAELSMSNRDFESLLRAVNPDDPSILFLTSGTTGKPKAALWSQKTLTTNVDNILEHWMKDGIPEDFTTLSFLPMNHIVETVMSFGFASTTGGLNFFSSGVSRLKDELAEVQPTAGLFVPRLWENMMMGVESQVSKAPAKKQKIFRWAHGVGKRYMAEKLTTGRASIKTALMYRLADKLVLQKVRHKLGLDHAHTLASGSAPLRKEVIEWFHGFGIEILEAYGQTEAGISLMTKRGEHSAGTVGESIPNVNVKISEDGELLIKAGSNVMLGYLNNLEATEKVIVDGWLHTGDLVELDKGGRIKIIGRNNDRIKLQDGIYYLPSPIEAELKKLDSVEDALVVGNGKEELTALIVLKSEIRERLIAEGKQDGDLLKDPEVLAAVQIQIKELNKRLKAEKIGGENGSFIKHIVLISRGFSEEKGELTKTLKYRRHIIEYNFRDIIR